MIQVFFEQIKSAVNWQLHFEMYFQQTIVLNMRTKHQNLVTNDFCLKHCRAISGQNETFFGKFTMCSVLLNSFSFLEVPNDLLKKMVEKYTQFVIQIAHQLRSWNRLDLSDIAFEIAYDEHMFRLEYFRSITSMQPDKSYRAQLNQTLSKLTSTESKRMFLHAMMETNKNAVCICVWNFHRFYMFFQYYIFKCVQFGRPAAHLNQIFRQTVLNKAGHATEIDIDRPNKESTWSANWRKWNIRNIKIASNQKYAIWTKNTKSRIS